MEPYGYIALASLVLNVLLLIEAHHQYRKFKITDKAYYTISYNIIQCFGVPHETAKFEKDNAKELKEYNLIKEKGTKYDRPC